MHDTLQSNNRFIGGQWANCSIAWLCVVENLTSFFTIIAADSVVKAVESPIAAAYGLSYL